MRLASRWLYGCKTFSNPGTGNASVQVDDDVMTPSMKLKRPQLQKKYQKQIDVL